MRVPRRGWASVYFVTEWHTAAWVAMVAASEVVEQVAYGCELGLEIRRIPLRRLQAWGYADTRSISAKGEARALAE